MARFAFQAQSVGIKVASVVELLLGFDYLDSVQIYHVFCTSGDIGLTNCSSREPVEIPDSGLPRNMNERAVRFKLEGGVLAWGVTEVEFGLHQSDQNDPVYTFKRRVRVAGGCIGGVNVLSTMKQLDRNSGRFELAKVLLFKSAPGSPGRPPGSGSRG
jgi:hypothetical protein